MERRPEQKTSCSSKEKMNAGFRCFQGLLNKESANCNFLYNTDLVIVPGGMMSQLQVLEVEVSKPFKN